MNESRLHPFAFKIFKDGKIAYHFGTLRGMQSTRCVIMEMRFNGKQNGLSTIEYYESLIKCNKFKMKI